LPRAQAEARIAVLDFIAELKDEGVRVGGKRVARLMRAAGIVGVSRLHHA